MVPLSALSKTSNIVGAEQLERYNGLLSAKVLGSGASGVSSGDAIKMVEGIAKENQIGRAHVELQSLMRISYAVFCLNKKKTKTTTEHQPTPNLNTNTTK